MTLLRMTMMIKTDSVGKVMDSRKKAALVQTAPHPALPMYERCTCKVLSLFAEEMQEIGEEGEEHAVPIPEELYCALRSQLEMYFPHVQSLSVLLMHIAQREHTTFTTPADLVVKRGCYHAPPGTLEQVLANVRRAIRGNDVLLVHEHVGAALILLDVDEQGAYTILERIYNSISLLQAETIVPPLKQETSVLLGIGTTTKADSSFEDVYTSAARVARAFHLRPIITAPALYERIDTQAGIVPFPTEYSKKTLAVHESKKVPSNIPFMTLPAEISVRLKHFVPHSVAVQIRCVPIGRNHHCLTVAMANPNNRSDIQRLAELTGMTIFPVACDDDALDLLLDRVW